MTRHIAILTTILTPGGLDRQLVSLANYLCEQGYRISIYSLLPRQPTTMIHESESLAVHYPPDKINRYYVEGILRGLPRMIRSIIADMPNFHRISDRIRRFKRHDLDDIYIPEQLFRLVWPTLLKDHVDHPFSDILGFSYQTIPFLDCIQERLKIPATYFEISSVRWRHDQGNSDPNEAEHLRRIAKIAVPARTIGDELRMCIDPSLQYQVVPLYLEMPEHIYTTSGAIPRTFGLAARLSPEKNQEVIIRVADHLVNHRGIHDVRVILAGNGPTEARLRALVKELRLQGAVEFLGQIDDIRPFYEEIGVVVLPSDVESLSATLLEALYFGKPIIATDVGANCELVRDNSNGFLIPDKEDIEALSNKVLQILDSPPLYERMAKESRRRYAELEMSAYAGLRSLLDNPLSENA